MNNWLKNTLERGIIRTTLKYNKVHDPKTGRFSSLGAGGSTAARKPRESKATGWGRQTISYSADDIKAPPESGKSRSYAIMPLSTFSKSNAYGGTVTRNEMVMRALGDMSDGTVVGGWTKVSTGNQTFWKKGSNTVLTLPSAVLNQSLHKSIVTRSISNGSLSPQKAISIHKGDYPGIANWPAVQKMLGLTSVSTKALLSDYIKKRMQVRDYKKAAPFLGKNVHPIARNKILGLLKKVSPNTPMGALRLQDNRRDARMKIKLSKLLTLPYQKSSQTSGGKTSVMISLQNPDRNNPDMYVPQNMLGSDGLSHGGWLNRDKFLTASAALNMKEKKTPASNKLDKGEYDEEGGMAKSQLQSIIRNAKAIYDGLEDDTNISEWAQSKITLAEDYISTVSNYMQGESEKTASKERKGLWHNIHAKKKRGEKPAKRGHEDYPDTLAFERSKNNIKYKSETTAPQWMRNNAKQGLEWVKDKKAGGGVTDKTIREAREMASGTVTVDKAMRMAAWFARHMGDLSSPDARIGASGYPSPGVVAHALWGGGSATESQKAKAWASSFSEKKSETLKAGKRNYRVEYDNYHGKPEQKSNRNNRNKARRQLGLVKGDGLEAHHKIPMSKGGVNGNGNIQTLTFSENRKRGNKSNGK